MVHGKQDRRMSGWQDFAYGASFFKTTKDGERMCDIREWCVETWGMSCELDLWYNRATANQYWCWTNDEYRIKIYFRTDAEYSLFLLKWT